MDKTKVFNLARKNFFPKFGLNKSDCLEDTILQQLKVDECSFVSYLLNLKVIINISIVKLCLEVSISNVSRQMSLKPIMGSTTSIWGPTNTIKTQWKHFRHLTSILQYHNNMSYGAIDTLKLSQFVVPSICGCISISTMILSWGLWNTRDTMIRKTSLSYICSLNRNCWCRWWWWLKCRKFNTLGVFFCLISIVAVYTI